MFYIILITSAICLNINYTQGQIIGPLINDRAAFSHLGMLVEFPMDLKHEAAKVHKLLITDGANAIAERCGSSVKITERTQKVYVILMSRQKVITDDINYDEDLLTKQVYMNLARFTVLIFTAKNHLAITTHQMPFCSGCGVYAFVKFPYQLKVVHDFHFYVLSKEANMKVSVERNFSVNERLRYERVLYHSCDTVVERGLLPWFLNTSNLLDRWDGMFYFRITNEVITFITRHYEPREFDLYSFQNKYMLRSNKLRNKEACETVHFDFCSLFTVQATTRIVFSHCEYTMNFTKTEDTVYPCMMNIYNAEIMLRIKVMVPYDYKAAYIGATQIVVRSSYASVMNIHADCFASALSLFFLLTLIIN